MAQTSKFVGAGPGKSKVMERGGGQNQAHRAAGGYGKVTSVWYESKGGVRGEERRGEERRGEERRGEEEALMLTLKDNTSAAGLTDSLCNFITLESPSLSLTHTHAHTANTLVGSCRTGPSS